MLPFFSFPLNYAIRHCRSRANCNQRRNPSKTSNFSYPPPRIRNLYTPNRVRNTELERGCNRSRREPSFLYVRRLEIEMRTAIWRRQDGRPMAGPGKLIHEPRVFGCRYKGHLSDCFYSNTLSEGSAAVVGCALGALPAALIPMVRP